MAKYLMTHSLLQSYFWAFQKDEGFAEFVNTLHRRPLKPTQAMLDGRQFEDMVTAYVKGAVLDRSHRWAEGIEAIGEECKGGVFQVRGSTDINVKGVNFVLYGIADNIEAGVIRDIKFSKSYDRFGKYAQSTQHPAYFRVFSGAHRFDYLIYNGRDVSRETYYPFDTPLIEDSIRAFMRDTERWEHEGQKLADIYIDNWRSLY